MAPLAQGSSSPPVCSFIFDLRSIPSISSVFLGCQRPITAFAQALLKQSYLPIMSLLIIRLSRLVYSGTMMKYASLTKDNDGEGLRVSVFQKASWIQSQESRLKRLSRRLWPYPNQVCRDGRTNTKIQSFL